MARRYLKAGRAVQRATCTQLPLAPLFGPQVLCVSTSICTHYFQAAPFLVRACSSSPRHCHFQGQYTGAQQLQLRLQLWSRSAAPAGATRSRTEARARPVPSRTQRTQQASSRASIARARRAKSPAAICSGRTLCSTRSPLLFRCVPLRRSVSLVGCTEPVHACGACEPHCLRLRAALSCACQCRSAPRALYSYSSTLI